MSGIWPSTVISNDLEEAFNYGAMEEFGMRDNHFEEDEQIISRETIERFLML